MATRVIGHDAIALREQWDLMLPQVDAGTSHGLTPVEILSQTFHSTGRLRSRWLLAWFSPLG